MAKQVINIGATANDGTGDTLRVAFGKMNSNFNELYVYVGNVRKQDWVEPYNYIGKAPVGSLDSQSVWTIKRLTVAIDGTVITETALNVKWNDRLTAIYS